MQERLLRPGAVLGLAAPGLERRGLEGAAVGERELPGAAAEAVHLGEVRGRVLVALAAREEDDPRHRGGHAVAEAAQRLLRDLAHGRLARALLARDDHVG